MSTATELEGQVIKMIRDGQMREAAEICDQMNQRFPEYESGWFTASKLALLVNEPMIAVRAIDRALQLSPGKPEWLQIDFGRAVTFEDVTIRWEKAHPAEYQIQVSDDGRTFTTLHEQLQCKGGVETVNRFFSAA